MSQDLTTIARPYAEAIFARAKETDSLAEWEQVLDFLATVTADPAMADVIANQSIEHQIKVDLFLDIGKNLLNDEHVNLIRLLAENDRLSVLSEIKLLFHQLQREQAGVVDVEVISAYALKPATQKSLAAALKKSLGRNVEIQITQDPSLIAGVRIRAGDTVIDGSVAGQLSQLANELGI